MANFCFYDWRRGKDGTHDPSFSLNHPRHAGASVLVTGKNFGCGSSREHAVWALDDFGFRAVIAPSFADIFANNCVKNGVLTVVLSEEEVAEITRRASDMHDYQLTIDLEQRKVHDDHGFSATFQIDDFTRHCLLNGLDDIGLTLQHEARNRRLRSPAPGCAKDRVAEREFLDIVRPLPARGSAMTLRSCRSSRKEACPVEATSRAEWPS